MRSPLDPDDFNAVKLKGIFQGAIFAVVVYVVTCSLAEQPWRPENLGAAFGVGILVNAITIAACYWLGFGLRVKSPELSVVIALLGYAAILATAIALAFIRLSSK